MKLPFASRPVVMRARRGNTWYVIGPTELLEKVQAFSVGLRTLGLQPDERMALISENRPEWAVADYACLAARGADVPIYPTLPAVQAEYMLRDSGAVMACVSTRQQLAKLDQIRAGLPLIRQVITFDPDLAGDGVLTMAEVEARGRAAADRYPDWREQALRVTSDDLATIIYTSGTTGEPIIGRHADARRAPRQESVNNMAAAEMALNALQVEQEEPSPMLGLQDASTRSGETACPSRR